MSDQLNSTSGWSQCEPETISDMVCAVRTRRRLRAITRSTTAVTAVVILAAGMFFAAGPSTDHDCHFGGISCTEVKAILTAYQAESLSTEVTSQVEPHLVSCPACREWLAMNHREKPQAAARALSQGRLTAANSADKAVQSDEMSPSLPEALLALR